MIYTVWWKLLIKCKHHDLGDLYCHWLRWNDETEQKYTANI